MTIAFTSIESSAMNRKFRVRDDWTTQLHINLMIEIVPVYTQPLP